MVEVIKAEDIPNLGDYDINIHNAIIVPKGATNGDMIKAIFPESDGYEYAVTKDLEIITLFVIKGLQVFYVNFDLNWWNAPYKRGNEND